VRGKGTGKGVDLRERATDGEGLGEQNRDQHSSVFLVTLVKCLLNGIPEFAQAFAERVAPMMDVVEVHEHCLRPGPSEFRALGKAHGHLAETLAARVITEHYEDDPVTGNYLR
jgi:hypothetical protein